MSISDDWACALHAVWRRYPEVSEDALSWIAPIIEQARDDGTYRGTKAILEAGGVMTEEEWQALDQPGAAQVGRQFWGALTPTGRENPHAVARHLFSCTVKLMQLDALLRRLASIDGYVELRATDPGCCKRAVTWNGKIFPAAQAPRLPFNSCTERLCLCSFLPAKHPETDSYIGPRPRFGISGC